MPVCIDSEQLKEDRPNKENEIHLKMLALGFKAQDGFYLLYRIPITERALVCIWPSRLDYVQAEAQAKALRRYGLDRSALDYCTRSDEYPTMEAAREALREQGVM